MKKKVFLVFLSVILSISLVLAGCSAPSPSTTSTQTTSPAETTKPQVYTIKVSGFGPPGHTNHTIMVNANKMLEERSNGRIKIDFFPTESLVKMADTPTALRDGVIGIGFSMPSYLGDAMSPVFDVVTLPFLWDVKKIQEDKLKKGPGSWHDYNQPAWNRNGMQLIVWTTQQYTQMVSRKPVHKLEDFNGLLVRTASAATPWMKALGATVVSMPGPDVYEALMRGTIDAALAGDFSVMAAEGQAENCGYFIELDAYAGYWPVVMSKKLYDELPTDLSKLIDDVYQECYEIEIAAFGKLYEESIQKIKAGKAFKEFYKPSAEEKARWVEAVLPVYRDTANKLGSDEWARFLKMVSNYSSVDLDPLRFD